jgi:hypothetical protein
VKIALADPDGSALHAYYTDGALKAEGSSITEGIGQGRVTRNLEGFRPDHSYRIPDGQALDHVFGLMRDEGLSLGGSSGINVAGAVRLARDLGPRRRTGSSRRCGPLRLEAVQPRLPARARPAGPVLAGGGTGVASGVAGVTTSGLRDPTVEAGGFRQTLQHVFPMILIHRDVINWPDG